MSFRTLVPHRVRLTTQCPSECPKEYRVVPFSPLPKFRSHRTLTPSRNFWATRRMTGYFVTSSPDEEYVSSFRTRSSLSPFGLLRNPSPYSLPRFRWKYLSVVFWSTLIRRVVYSHTLLGLIGFYSLGVGFGLERLRDSCFFSEHPTTPSGLF